MMKGTSTLSPGRLEGCLLAILKLLFPRELVAVSDNTIIENGVPTPVLLCLAN